MKVLNKLPVVLGLASCLAFAQSSPDGASTLSQQSQNGITYMCGGVGLDESTYMKSSARDHDLSLVFAAQDGAYLANVGVEISDARGNLLVDTNCSGPMMLVDFPRTGTYQIKAESRGQILARDVHVTTNGHAKSVFTWPRNFGSEGPSLSAR